MKTKKQKPDFLAIGRNLTAWYAQNARDLPFRKTKDPYQIWICEIIFQQTQIAQGLSHFNNFVARFPDVHALAQAQADEVMLYWKGLGYYSRALNLHRAAQKIMQDFGGTFPERYEDILSLPGVGKYTAAAIASIAFGERLPAVDGNFYRVFSRFFADPYDIASSGAFAHFSGLVLPMMPKEVPGAFNEAVMDLGSEICRPKQPKCPLCPLNRQCAAFLEGRTAEFPVKLKRTKVSDEEMTYYFVNQGDTFLVRRRGNTSIWKNLYEFPTVMPEEWYAWQTSSKIIAHKLTHKNLKLKFLKVDVPPGRHYQEFAAQHGFVAVSYAEATQKSFPKPLENYLHDAQYNPELF